MNLHISNSLIIFISAGKWSTVGLVRDRWQPSHDGLRDFVQELIHPRHTSPHCDAQPQWKGLSQVVLRKVDLQQQQMPTCGKVFEIFGAWKCFRNLRRQPTGVGSLPTFWRRSIERRRLGIRWGRIGGKRYERGRNREQDSARNFQGRVGRGPGHIQHVLHREADRLLAGITISERIFRHVSLIWFQSDLSLRRQKVFQVK